MSSDTQGDWRMKRLSLLIKICLVLIAVLTLMRTASFDFITYSMLEGIGPAVVESIEALPASLAVETVQPAPNSGTQELPEAQSSSDQPQTSDEILALKAESIQPEESQMPAETSLVPEPQPPFFEIGKHIKLLPKDSGPVISFPSTFQILAQLENPYPNKPWRVQVEATVTHQDGSMLTAVKKRAILLFPGQSIELPIKVKANAPRYQPGVTLFTALIKDMSGQIIDEAKITFQFQVSDEF